MLDRVGAIKRGDIWIISTFALDKGLWVLRVRLGMDSFRVGYVRTRSQHYTLNSAEICPINPNHLSIL